jgi:hypothetical protein
LHWPAEQSNPTQQSGLALHGESPVPQQTGAPTAPSVARAHERFVSVPQHSLALEQSCPRVLPAHAGQVGQMAQVGQAGHFFFFFFLASLAGAEASSPAVPMAAPLSAIRSVMRRELPPTA